MTTTTRKRCPGSKLALRDTVPMASDPYHHYAAICPVCDRVFSLPNYALPIHYWAVAPEPTPEPTPEPRQRKTREHGFQSLLTPDGYNPKLKKGRARGYSSAVMHLAPANLSGLNVCQFASAGCKSACLNTAGHGGIIKKGETTNAIQLARIARTQLFWRNRPTFNALLVREIETHCRRARKHGLTPVVRLNGTSDLPWERLRLNDGRTVLETFPDVQFYDYTKNPTRALANAAGEHPSNYTVVFSRSETNAADVERVLAAGGNVAVVFQRYLPDVYAGRRVFNGDADDLRFLDPHNVVIGLKAKGPARKDPSGFTVLQDAAAIALPVAA